MKHKKIRSPENIAWTVETKGIVVIDTFNSRSIFLHEPEAAIWSLLIKYGVNKKEIDIIGAIFKMTEKETKELIESLLIEWYNKGLII
jgi:hypothetical protein